MVGKFLEGFNGLRSHSLPDLQRGKYSEEEKEQIRNLDRKLQVTAQKTVDTIHRLKRQTLVTTDNIKYIARSMESVPYASPDQSRKASIEDNQDFYED